MGQSMPTLDWVSPPTRGWSLKMPKITLASSGFPAHAGMVLS